METITKSKIKHILKNLIESENIELLLRIYNHSHDCGKFYFCEDFDNEFHGKKSLLWFIHLGQNNPLFDIRRPYHRVDGESTILSLTRAEVLSVLMMELNSFTDNVYDIITNTNTQCEDNIVLKALNSVRITTHKKE